jgi:heme/copper-type cytochrome/quinol oxidase subunit 2
MKKVFVFIYCIVVIFVMLVSSKSFSNYYAVQANIEPLSKSASLLTLLFLLFFFLGVFFTVLVVLMWVRYSKTKS